MLGLGNFQEIILKCLSQVSPDFLDGEVSKRSGGRRGGWLWREGALCADGSARIVDTPLEFNPGEAKGLELT